MVIAKNGELLNERGALLNRLELLDQQIISNISTLKRIEKIYNEIK